MSTTIKSTETPELELVSVAEDALVQNDELILDNTDTLDSATAECEQVDQVVETDVAGKSKSELVDMLAHILENNAAEDVRQQVEQIKTAFYKIHRAQVDARNKEAAEQGVEAEVVADVDELRLKELLKLYRDARDKAVAESDKIKEENYRLKCEIIEELKSLISSEETLNVTFARFRELQSRWKEIGQVPQSKVNDVWETYNLHVERFYDFVKINKELRDLDLKKNLEAKVALCEAAEALAEQVNIVEAFRKLQKLHDQWRETGPVAPEQKEALWERFKAASSVVNRRHQEHFESIKQEQVKNLEAKVALCEAAEALVVTAPTSHKEWNKANERLMELQGQWRGIGFAPKRDNAKIYDRFRAACDKFFELKHAFYADVKDDMEQNLVQKVALCEAAEALTGGDDWKAATDRLLELQAEWKKIGTVSRRHADAIWRRFRAACDEFFENKSAHFANVEGGYADNLQKKQALLEEMNAADVKAGGYDLIKEYQRRWSEIGFVPIKHKEEIAKLYKQAIDRMFAVVRGADRENSLNKFKEKVNSMRQGGERRLRSEREKLYNRVRQLEQEVATLENNIGFFSKSKGAESFIAEVEEKIVKAKRDIADTIAKIKLIDENQQ
ncbi:MAG: DUF349 domain-containing protein [Alistipes sp.]|nr:DUF349 domain-containing protein [Alistipes sp.]